MSSISLSGMQRDGSRRWMYSRISSARVQAGSSWRMARHGQP